MLDRRRTIQSTSNSAAAHSQSFPPFRLRDSPQQLAYPSLLVRLRIAAVMTGKNHFHIRHNQAHADASIWRGSPFVTLEPLQPVASPLSTAVACAASAHPFLIKSALTDPDDCWPIELMRLY